MIQDDFRPYIGYGECLGQKDLDQGDSSQRDGCFYALAKMLGLATDFMGEALTNGYIYTISQHQSAIGLYRRSPNPLYWGSNPNNFSRDQHQVLRIAMAVMGDKKRVRQSAWAMIKRFGFHQNIHPGTDIDPIKPWYVQIMIKVYKLTTGRDIDWWKVPDLMTPSEIAVCIRGLDLWSLIPLLWFLDATMWIDLKVRKDDNWDSDNMMALNFLYANYKYSTFVSRWLMKKYLKTNFMDRIKNYYSEEKEANGLAPMAKLFELVYNKYVQENL